MRNTSIREIEDETGRLLGKQDGEPPVVGSATGSVVVKLEVIHDKDAGLSMNQYSWIKDGKYEMQTEVANRPAAYRGINQYGSPSFSVMAYDEKIDRPMAETRRSAIEMMVNAKPQNAPGERPGTPDGSLATETRKPGSLHRDVMNLK